MKKNSYNYDYNASNLDLYLHEIGKFPLLTKKEEEEIGYRILNGDQKAVNELFHANLRLAASFALKLFNPKLNYQLDVFDLIEEANMGLYEACQKFDIRKKRAFSGFAYIYMKRFILNAINNQTKESKMNGDLYSKLSDFKTKKESLELHFGRTLSNSELAKYLHCSIKDVYTYQHYINKPARLNGLLETESGTIELIDAIIDETENVEEKVETKIMIEDVQIVMKEVLNPKELEVIKKRYGFDGIIMTCEEISNNLLNNGKKCSRQRISYIEKMALLKIRDALNRKKEPKQKILAITN